MERMMGFEPTTFCMATRSAVASYGQHRMVERSCSG